MIVLSGVGDHDAVLRRRQHALVDAQRALGELAPGDVLEHDDEVAERAGLVLLAGEAHVAEDDLSLLRLEASLHPVVADLAPTEQLPLLHVDLEILQMADLGVRLLEQLGGLVAEDLAEPLVDAQPAAVRRHVRDPDARLLEGAAVAAFARGEIGASLLARPPPSDAARCRRSRRHRRARAR